jgi:hypothetical protein
MNPEPAPNGRVAKWILLMMLAVLLVVRATLM